MKRAEPLIERSNFFFVKFELLMVSAERVDVVAALQAVCLAE
jgi:hypothetical protein